MEFLLGVVSGLITTIFFWLIKNKITPPKVEFGNDISRITYPSGNVGYIIILKNIGHRRLIDISLKVIIYIPEIVTWDKSLTQKFNLKTSSDDKILLEKAIPITTRIILEESNDLLNSGLIPANIKNTITEKQYALDELLKLSPKSYLRIFLLGNDEVTGVRKVFESGKYSLANIKDGKFNRKTMLI